MASGFERSNRVRCRRSTGWRRTTQAFDLIYIDGSHMRDDVLLDSVLAWRLLAPDGVCIWDDYEWGMSDRSHAERPREAIDAFLDLHSAELRVLHTGSQIIAEKRPALAAGYEPAPYPRSAANLMRFLTRRPMRF